jgi:MFS family permease
MLGRRGTLGLLAAFGAFGVFWGGWAALLPAIKAAVGGSDSQMGFAFLGGGLGALPAMIATGPIYDRFGERTLLPVMILFGMSTLFIGLASSVGWLFASLLLVGALSGALDVCINAAVSGWESMSGRRLMNLAHAAFSGSFLVTSISVGVARRAGAGSMAVLVCLASVMFLAAVLNRAPEIATVSGSPRRSLRFNRVFWMLGALCALAFVIEGGIESWSALHLERTLGANPAVGGLGPGLFAAAMVTGRMLSHVIGSRLSDARVLTLGGTIGGIGLVATAVAPAVPWALAGLLCTGAGISVAAPTLFGVSGRVAPGPLRGSALSTVTTVAYLGFLIGPPVVGWIAGATSLRIGVACLAVVSLALAVLGGRVRDLSLESDVRTIEPASAGGQE